MPPARQVGLGLGYFSAECHVLCPWSAPASFLTAARIALGFSILRSLSSSPASSLIEPTPPSAAGPPPARLSRSRPPMAIATPFRQLALAPPPAPVRVTASPPTAITIAAVCVG